MPFTPTDRVTIHNVSDTTYLLENGWSVPSRCCESNSCLKGWFYGRIPWRAAYDADPHDGKPAKLAIVPVGASTPAAAPAVAALAEVVKPAAPEVVTAARISLAIPAIETAVERKMAGAAFLEEAAVKAKRNRRRPEAMASEPREPEQKLQPEALADGDPGEVQGASAVPLEPVVAGEAGEETNKSEDMPRNRRTFGRRMAREA